PRALARGGGHSPGFSSSPPTKRKCLYVFPALKHGANENEHLSSQSGPSGSGKYAILIAKFSPKLEKQIPLTFMTAFFQSCDSRSTDRARGSASSPRCGARRLIYGFTNPARTSAAAALAGSLAC